MKTRMMLDQAPKKQQIKLTISPDSLEILEKLHKKYEISKSRVVELILLQSGPRLLKQKVKS